MPKLATPLTDVRARTAKSKDKPYKLSDGGGLYLLVNTDGAKYWRMDYRFVGVRRTLEFGKYPEFTFESQKKQAIHRWPVFLFAAGAQQAPAGPSNRHVATAPVGGAPHAHYNSQNCPCN